MPLALCLAAVPLPLELRAHRLVALFLAVIIAWVTEVVPVSVTALAIGPLLVVFGVCDAPSAFRYYADPLLFLFVGGFFIAAAMSRHGLDRRIARAIVSLPFARDGGTGALAALALAGVMLSLWISNTAACAMLVPILLGLPAMRREGRGARDPATGALLVIAYVCSTGGMGTLVGTPPNLICVRLLGEAGHDIGFVSWLAIGLPTAILLSVLAFVMTVGRAHASSAPSAPAAASEPLGPMSYGERVTAVCFGLAVVGWAVPDLLVAAGVEGASVLADHAHPGAVAVLAALPLFVFRDPRPDRGEGVDDVDAPGPAAVLPWREAVKIDWGVIFLFGGGIALGKQLTDTGLAEVISRGVVVSTGVSDLWALTALACVFTIFFTEVCSNTAATNMIVPLVIALADEIGVSPVPPAIAAALAASCAFMLPIATGPNAIVFGTGRVPQASMMRAGFWLNIASAIAIVVLLRLIAPLMGWA